MDEYLEDTRRVYGVRKKNPIAFVKDGQWVRIKNGLYGGDLARVHYVDYAKRKAMVKLVPRVFTHAELQAYHESEDDKVDKDNERVKNLQRARTALKKGIKPPQRHFQQNEHQGWTTRRDAETDRIFTIYNHNYYYGGLICRIVPFKNLVTGIKVTPKERNLFEFGAESVSKVLILPPIHNNLKGHWVRVREGLYDGDLAQIDSVNDYQRKVVVKLVPRLFTEAEEHENQGTGDDKGGKGDRVNNLQKARAARKKGVKPPQRLFQENEFKGLKNHNEYDHSSQRDRHFTIYKNNRYSDGLLYKMVAYKNLVTQNINVTDEESKLFPIVENIDTKGANSENNDLIEEDADPAADFQ